MRVPGLSGNTTDSSDSEVSDMELDTDNSSSDNREIPQSLPNLPGAWPPQNPDPLLVSPRIQQPSLATVQIPQSPFLVQVPTPNQNPAPVAQTQGLGQTPTQTPPQTPPQTPQSQYAPDLDATPRASRFGDQPSTQPPPSPTEVPPAAKKRRAGTPPANTTQPSGSSKQGNDTNMFKILLDQQTKLITQLYEGIRQSNAEQANKQTEQIDKLTGSVQHNSTVLGRVLEKLDVGTTGQNKGKSRQVDPDEEESRQSGGAANATAKDADAARDTPAFTFATKKKGKVRSGVVKRRPQEELREKDLMRKWFNEVMGSRDLYANEVSQDEADVFAAKFKKNPLARPCTVQNFRYWIAGTPKSAWNKGASYVFVDILEEKQLITKPDHDTRDRIREAFFVRLKTLHGIWLDKQKMDDGDNNYSQPLLSKRRQRKYNLFHRRREVILIIPELKGYLEDFDQLGVGGMSSDEEDSEMEEGTLRYRIKEPYWRGHQLTQWLRLLDCVHLESRCSVDSEGNLFGFTRGAAPRLRVAANDRTSKGAYVAGLPVNFYDAEWLEKQESGWAKGGAGFVNQIIRPRRATRLEFPTDLARVLSERKYPGTAQHRA
ncbi:hypothetical protein FB446DRAFT_790631 [Lentinula raphanica]|nr:hypothetical protein FB446DRAFT_790631 [Lentinula raphanica]